MERLPSVALMVKECLCKPSRWSHPYTIKHSTSYAFPHAYALLKLHQTQLFDIDIHHMVTCLHYKYDQNPVPP
ncbi:hypothetical protein I7I48_08284 [Histoplasma ohiense]|nr:hypothetical protein I7I48_08284 [Histoplasma ohiense (nom. inval.)]